VRQAGGYVYILTNKNHTVLYTGVTSDLLRRMGEHRQGRVVGFSKKYNLSRLIFAEQHPTIMSAIQREKQIKGWLRSKKIELVNSLNPEWKDLADFI